ncbi:MAG: dihydropteroate synthase [Bacteroidales bacterium]|nr:dihydropteroate synthase [Bacteroidales bacterium]
MTTGHFFSKRRTLNCNGRLLNIDKPIVMGIINLTPDSFFEGSRHYRNVLGAIEKAEEMLSQGAAIIDLGASSSRPGSAQLDQEQERERLMPALKAIRKQFPQAFISVDTYWGSLAWEAYNEGADIINDISGGDFDPEMFETVARTKLPYILMHIKGTPQTMQLNPQYDNIIKEVSIWFANKIERLKQSGIKDIILDPGFGFGKNMEHNYQLMFHLNHFRIFEMPLLVGISRKSMITKLLDIQAPEALNGTTALNTLALLNGADILRVHDVKEALETIMIVEKYNQNV